MAEDELWNHYVRRFRTYPVLHNVPVRETTKLAVTIPVCAEPDVISTLESLNACEHPDADVDVILLFNENVFLNPEERELHQKSYLATVSWIQDHVKPWMTFIPVKAKMPDPKGGVGWARKLAMDEAARRIGSDGIIICLDADCTVAENYLKAIRIAFEDKPKMDAASIYFEHHIKDHDEEDPILLYELHLRYLLNAQRWCGHPFSFYTVGSSMAVRRNAYLLQGGMNTRRAGEDFYFLQKFIETGRMFEINATVVHPSARVSSRVPFGTGRAMMQMAEGKKWMSPDFRSFVMILSLFQSLEELYQNSIGTSFNGISDWISAQTKEIRLYLLKSDFKEQVNKIANNTRSFPAFEKRFFRYFNAFRMIKYLHFMRDHFFPDIPTEIAVTQLLAAGNALKPPGLSMREMLEVLRTLDRSKNWPEKD